MAGRELSRTIGDALLSATEWAWPHVRSRVDAALEHVAELARPHPPMTVRTLDGEILTGLVVVDHGQAVFFLGVREPGRSAPPQPPPRFDDEPLWSRDLQVDPYRRHP